MYGERPEIPLDLICQPLKLTVPGIFRTGCSVFITRALEPGLFLRGFETRRMRNRISTNVECWIGSTVGEYLRNMSHRRRKNVCPRIQPLEPSCHLLSVPFLYTFPWCTEKRYASLFFVACIDQDDNELITLEKIHLFVEVLDRYFGNVCELDIIFNFHKAYYILDELFIGGELQVRPSVLSSIPRNQPVMF